LASPTPIPYPNLWGIDWPTSVVIALTLATVLLAVVAIILVLGGIFAFLNIRRDAREVAERTARETAERISEEVANLYLQEQLPVLFDEYAKFMAGAATATGATGDRIAEEESEISE